MEIETINKENSNSLKFAADPLISFVVPIYDIPAMVFKRCLMSLSDQDYENKEVIMVFDGSNPELEQIAEPFLTNTEDSHGGPNSWRKIVIEHAGACAARNAGFKESSGEIVSFFNSDYIAKPGMVRLWVDSLQKNPDCGFVYGGYEYNSSRRWSYPSGSFDEWQEMIENFIDCGFPLWRKYVVEWDVNCKSLQDWDFWIRVIKTHKVKGYYLGRDYSFIAEMPRSKGLSDDSSNNWNDRVNYIKKKNNLPNREILVDSLGAQNHGVQIARMIDADFRRDTWHKTEWIPTYKALYMIGFYIKPNEGGMNEHVRRLAIFKEKYPQAKRIVHFVGADIYWLKKFPWESLKYLAGALRMSCDAILSENQTAHDELLEYGIPTQIVPIPSYTPNWEVKQLPQEFKVALYLVEPGTGTGQSDFDKYCYEPTLSIVRAMPDVQFTAYGHGGQDVKYPNLKHYGIIPREKWSEYVYENSALMRLVRHDHNPMASNEFIMAGRDVITNAYTLGAHLIDTSGKKELNEFDKFGEGFNQYNWPETKAQIIRKIREIKKNPYQTDSYAQELIKTLDRETYIQTIKGLCNV